TWDYERLVLERFPEIYKAKCIPAHLAGTFDPPGKVRVVVIPDVRNRLPFDPFAAKAPADLLAEITEYLGARTSGAVALTVTNAHFVAVMVHVAVRFRAGANEGYHRKLLGEELNRFLSPWAWDEGAEIVVGGKIYANSIVDFLDRRPYVDYVVDLRLYTSDDGSSFVAAPPAGEDGYFVTGERPDAVLVAARQHRIDVIPEAGYEAELM
ncbi:MAG: hypothetical protein GY856_34510, partial [bacterium]|nr:hypothetical protein [bacterium]